MSTFMNRQPAFYDWPALKHTPPSGAGAYVGCMYHEYIDVMVQHGAQIPSQAFVGNGPPYLVGRVSYGFGWTGPCVSTDTACSSSLVAAHLAQKVSSLLSQHDTTCLLPAVRLQGGLNQKQSMCLMTNHDKSQLSGLLNLCTADSLLHVT